MNIVKKECRQQLKAFVIWAAALAFLVLGAMVKFVGVSSSGSGELNAMLAQFPKPVLAMFGMAEVNIESFSGYYSVLEFYAMIAVSCYAISLGTNCVLRESVDKTYEFLFTKPCGRLHVLSMKMVSALIFLVLIWIVNGACSYVAPVLYNIDNDIGGEMMGFCVALALVSLFFFFLSMALSTWLGRSERAVQASYGILLVMYALAVVFDLDKKLEVVRILTPFKYFRPSELIRGNLSGVYAAVIVAVSVLLAVGAFVAFKKKDLTAA